jgi:glc operon protein GlcG
MNRRAIESSITQKRLRCLRPVAERRLRRPTVVTVANGSPRSPNRRTQLVRSPQYAECADTVHMQTGIFNMQTKPFIALEDATRVLAAARAEAEANKWAVSIAVVDDGGHLLGMVRLDGCAPIGAEISIGKARTSALGRRESKGYEDMVNGGRTAFVTAPILTTLEGGVPLIVGGHVVGAVGVSGVKPAEDSQIAKAGAAALA